MPENKQVKSFKMQLTVPPLESLHIEYCGGCKSVERITFFDHYIEDRMSGFSTCNYGSLGKKINVE